MKQYIKHRADSSVTTMKTSLNCDSFDSFDFYRCIIIQIAKIKVQTK
jgi:hypothetical protein